MDEDCLSRSYLDRRLHGRINHHFTERHFAGSSSSGT
jgi:hypothetical protein